MTIDKKWALSVFGLIASFITGVLIGKYFDWNYLFKPIPIITGIAVALLTIQNFESKEHIDPGPPPFPRRPQGGYQPTEGNPNGPLPEGGTASCPCVRPEQVARWCSTCRYDRTSQEPCTTCGEGYPNHVPKDIEPLELLAYRKGFEVVQYKRRKGLWWVDLFELEDLSDAPEICVGELELETAKLKVRLALNKRTDKR